jgi:hypothetical protein
MGNKMLLDAAGSNASAQSSWLNSGFSPVIWNFLVIQVPNASDQWPVPLDSCPLDSFILRFEGGEHIVGMIFDNIIINASTLGSTLRARFYIHVSHSQ